MVRPREFDEEEVLEKVVDTFWSRGYDGTSIADLEEATGLGRQSLYNTFGGKRELFARAVEHYRVRAEAGRLGIAESGLAGIRTFFQMSLEFLVGEGEGRGCFLGRVRLDPSGVEVAGASCDRSEGSIAGFLRRRLLEAREGGELHPGVDVDVAAGLLSTLSRGVSAAMAAGETVEQLRAEVELVLGAISRQTTGGEPGD